MGISWWWLNEFDAAMLALVLAAALRWGAGPERLCVAVLVGMEAIDLVYHLIVLLAERGLTPKSFLEVLEERAAKPRSEDRSRKV